MESNDFTGAYTDLLLDGLSGRGDCLDFDCDNKVYRVKPVPLADYLDDIFRGHPDWKQVPQHNGDFDGKLILAELKPSTDIKPVKLALELTPLGARVRSITIEDLSGCGDAFAPVIDPAALPMIYPRRYKLQLDVAGFEPVKALVNVFQNPTKITIQLKAPPAVVAAPAAPAQPAAAVPSHPAAPARPSGPVQPTTSLARSHAPARPTAVVHVASKLARAMELKTARRAEAVPAKQTELAKFSVTVRDELAQISLTDMEGRVVRQESKEPSQAGAAKASFSGLEPGAYRARVELPGARVVEEVVGLLPGDDDSKEIQAPAAPGTRLSDEFIHFSGLAGHLHEDCEYCDAARKAAEAKNVSSLVTIVSDAVARGSADARHTRWLEKLGLKLDLKTVAPLDSGLQIFFATELGNRPAARDYASKVELRFWRLDEPAEATARLTESSEISGLGGFSRKALPGAYWLAIRLPGDDEVTFAIALLASFVTKLVLNQDPDGLVKIHQYLISGRPDGPPRPALLRRLDQVERLLLNRNLASAREVVGELIAPKALDPVSGCIGAYLLYSAGKLDELDGLSKRMVAQHPALSDTYVIRAVLNQAQKNGVNIDPDLEKALKLGPPILRPWLNKLGASIGQGSNDPRARLIKQMLARAVPHPVWSAWLPGPIAVGQRIEPSTR